MVLANPISEEMKAMRPSLLPGLVAAARRNVDRGATSVRLFEVGRRYLADAERPTVGLLLAGERAPRSWQAGKAQGFDAFDAKAEALALLAAAGAPVDNLQLIMGAGDDLASGPVGDAGPGPRMSSPRSASCTRAWPRRSMRRPARSRPKSTSTPFPRRATSERARPAFTPPALQAVTRDFAFVVPADLAGRRAGPRGPRRRQGADHRCRGCSTATKASRD